MSYPMQAVRPPPSGLMRYPEPSSAEREGVVATARLLGAHPDGLVIEHPFVDLRVQLNTLIGPRLSYLISIGEYELGDLELIERHVVRGDRVLELGGGTGMTAALCARRSGEPVLVVEPDERLHPLITRQVELNGGRVSIEAACAVGVVESPSLSFFVSDELWFSSLTQDNREVPSHRIEVRPRAFAALLDEHKPTVVMIDIEGAERDLFNQPIAHRPRLLLVEIHVPQLSETGACTVIQRIIDLGYALVDLRSWTFVFARR